MEEQKDSLDQRQANCRIWVHLFLWWFVPLGWLISTIKMRYPVPAFIMVVTAFLAILTDPYLNRSLSNKEAFIKSTRHILTYQVFAVTLGSAITVGQIVHSRQKTENSDSLPHDK